MVSSMAGDAKMQVDAAVVEMLKETTPTDAEMALMDLERTPSSWMSVA